MREQRTSPGGALSTKEERASVLDMTLGQVFTEDAGRQVLSVAVAKQSRFAVVFGGC